YTNHSFSNLFGHFSKQEGKGLQLFSLLSSSQISMEDPFDSYPDGEELKEIKEALQNNDTASAAAKAQEYLEQQDNIPLHIGITGESGSGKSTFVNAFRGIDNRDDEAAPTGCVETTLEVTPYPHPKYPNVTVWDLPGIGTTSFPADKYLEHVGFEKFDFFIIISADRFRENDVKLAKEIQKMGKKFYFVRSKIDHNLRDAERSQREFNEKNTLDQIRGDCLQKQGVESPQVFLVSSFDLHLYDFHLLEETLERELPAHKRNALLLAIPSINLEIINKKKEVFQAKIKWLALASAFGAGVPVPGLSDALDLGMTVKFIICARLTVADLRAEGSRFIPLFGIPVAMSLSFISTYRALSTFLNMLAEDAQRVFTKALGLNTSV
uniref:Immunity-related GTPase family, f1 n=1 Tax=Lates calcarifer TaxID=8187 RepID=A0A4W6C912_LATCA